MLLGGAAATWPLCVVCAQLKTARMEYDIGRGTAPQPPIVNMLVLAT